MKRIPESYKAFDPFIRHKSIFGIKYIAIRIIDIYKAVERVKRPHNGIALHKVEEVFDAEVKFNSLFEFLGYLNVLDGKPLRVSWPVIVGFSNQ